jgi:hypothetical protein
MSEKWYICSSSCRFVYMETFILEFPRPLAGWVGRKYCVRQKRINRLKLRSLDSIYWLSKFCPFVALDRQGVARSMQRYILVTFAIHNKTVSQSNSRIKKK